MRATPITLLALLLAACQPAPTQPDATLAGGESASVVRVIDGDSLVVAVNGDQVEVRLLGLNAPEGSECHGDAAKGALEDLLASGTVSLVRDEEGQDQFDRLLRYLYVENIDVNLELIASGNATVVQGDHSRDGEFAAAADSAANARLGMWSPTACGSEPTRDVVIADYVYNPPGPDGDNLTDELVVVGNSGDEGIDLSGWIIRDESAQHRYRFPGGFTLAARSEVVVRTGCGADTQEDLFWCARNPVWSNGGDTVIVQSEDGTVVARDRFDGDY
ncbi:MAG: lamin tail domain-containing protein [Acidimicrobiia bacterium]|nr:lamin tail domain-containing protein [Acidimicrobiia bacterium]